MTEEWGWGSYEAWCPDCPDGEHILGISSDRKTCQGFADDHRERTGHVPTVQHVNDEWDTAHVHEETERDHKFGAEVAEKLRASQEEQHAWNRERERIRADHERDEKRRTFHLHVTNWGEMPKVEGLKDIVAAILWVQSATKAIAWEMRWLGRAVLIGAGVIGLMIVVAAIIMRGG